MASEYERQTELVLFLILSLLEVLLEIPGLTI